jgi:hypothetical protein
VGGARQRASVVVCLARQIKPGAVVDFVEWPGGGEGEEEEREDYQGRRCRRSRGPRHAEKCPGRASGSLGGKKPARIGLFAPR